MANYHYWYKGGWRCKGGGKPADAVAGSDLPNAPDPRQSVPAGFAEKIAGLQFRQEIGLRDGTQVRWLGGPKDGSSTDPSETLYPVRVASGPDAGQMLLVRPDELDL